MTTPTFKIVLIGDGGVGKTTWIKRHLTGEFERKYMATIAVDVHPFFLFTTGGRIDMTIWDTAGQEKFGAMRDGYYTGADAFICFFDLTSRTSYHNTRDWIRWARDVCPDAPIVLVGNKADVKGRKVTYNQILSYMANLELSYYDISAKSNYNFYKPFLHILQTLVDSDLQLAPEPVAMQ